MSVAGRDTELRPLRNIRASRNCLPPPREIEIATAVRELRANYYYGQTGELFRPFIRELRAKSARFIAGRSHFEQIPGSGGEQGRNTGDPAWLVGRKTNYDPTDSLTNMKMPANCQLQIKISFAAIGAFVLALGPLV